MVLVTGGTGLVGSHLLLSLVEKGIPIKALYRTERSLNDVEKVFSYYTEKSAEIFQKITWLKADITDIPALEHAFEDIEEVYHAAALISFDPNDYEALLKTNMEGTANIVNCCLTGSVKKLCYVSSIATIGSSVDGTPTDEETEFSEQHANVYARSKYRAELEVWRGSQEGLPVVIVNPGVIIGPGFWEGGSGTLFKTAQKGYRHYPPGGTGFVSVQDVVKMMIALMDSPITNERYLAVSENLTYREILSKLSKNLGLKAPSKQLKFWQLELLRILDVVWNAFTKRGRKLTKNNIRSLRQQEAYDTIKSKNDFDFHFEPLDGILHFSCKQFKEENP